MDVSLKFELPKDACAFSNHMKGPAYHRCLEEFSEYLRAELKYQCDNYTDDQYALLEKVKENFFEILEENEIEI